MTSSYPHLLTAIMIWGVSFSEVHHSYFSIVSVKIKVQLITDYTQTSWSRQEIYVYLNVTWKISSLWIRGWGDHDPWFLSLFQKNGKYCECIYKSHCNLKKKNLFFFYYLEHFMLTGKVLCLSQETSVKTEMASYNIRRLLIGPNQRFSSPSMCDPVGSARGCLTRTRWLHWKQTPKNVLQYIYIPVSLHADIVNLYFSN